MSEAASKISVEIRAQLDSFERDMKRADAILVDNARKIERSASQMTSRIAAQSRMASQSIGDSLASGLSPRRIKAAQSEVANSFVAFGRTIGGAVSVAFAADQLRQFIDEASRIRNVLKMAGYEGIELERTFGNLYSIAQRQGAPLEATATLFGRLTQAQKELNATAPEMMRFTEGVAMALRVQGTTATQARGSLLQLSQAMATGTVRAEEYNSINEGAYPVLKAVAAGLKETGGSVAILRNLVMQGKVSSEAFFRAFLAGMPLIESQSKQASITIGQSFERLKNSFVNAADGLNRATGASEGLVRYLEKVSDVLDRIAVAAPAARNAIENLLQSHSKLLQSPSNIAVDPMGNPIASYEDLGQTAPQASPESIAATRAIDSRLRAINSYQGTGPNRRPSSMYSNEISQIQDYQGTGPNRRPTGPKITPVSIADYPALPKGGMSTGTGGSSRNDAFDSEIEKVRRQTQEQRLAAEAIGKSALEADKAKISFELMNAAQASGEKITPELRGQIDQLATAYAEAKAKTDELKESQQMWADLQQELSQAVSGYFSDIVSGGKNAQDAIMNLTKRLADMALQWALLGRNGNGGLIGSLFGSLPSLFGGGAPIPSLYPTASAAEVKFANGTYFAQGGPALVGENGPERVFLPRGAQVIPTVETRRMMQGGQAVNINIHQTFTADSNPRELAAIAGRIKEEAKAGVFEAMARGQISARR